MPNQAQPKVVVSQLGSVYKKSKALMIKKPVKLLDETSF